MTDEQIIQLLLNRSETGLKELENKYSTACKKLSFAILNNTNDAEECVNDAYLGVWNSVPPTVPNPLVAYLYKIVRNISVKKYYKNVAKKRNSYYDVNISELENYLPSKNSVQSEIETKELTAIIETFLETLSVENRVIFMARYWFVESYSDIAKRVGSTEKNVSVRLARTRSKLKKYLLEREVLL